MRRSREDTNQFVHQAESPAQMKRRYRKSVLKKEFRETAGKTATKVFGEKSALIDIIREKENCTEAIADGMAKLSSPADFNRFVGIFFNSIELEEGELESGTAITNEIVSCNSAVKGKALASAVEILLATENERLALDFLDRIRNTNPDKSLDALEGLIKISRIEYIHTMTACARGFVENPEAAFKQIEKIASKIGARLSSPGEDQMLFSDLVLERVVKDNLGIE